MKYGKKYESAIAIEEMDNEFFKKSILYRVGYARVYAYLKYGKKYESAIAMGGRQRAF